MTTINAAQLQTLRNIEDAKRDLEGGLAKIEHDARNALLDLKAGGRVDGGSGFSPIGHQTPFDIATAATRLNQAMSTARMLGIPNELVDDVYTGKQSAWALKGDF